MGFAFYGRSFTLASPACWGPGCPWVCLTPFLARPITDAQYTSQVSGGNPGPCSATSGILMWSEMEGILNASSDTLSALDPVAAVNYMEWDL